MLSKDAKPLPDLATDSQAKYKEMKQALIAEINVICIIYVLRSINVTVRIVS